MSEKNTNKYAIVDLEATSASSTASIIQVGIVIMQNGQVIDEFASDVNPHQELDDHIIHLTGITDQQLAQAPDFSEIARTIFELIEDCIFVAHNVKFGGLRTKDSSCGYCRIGSGLLSDVRTI